MLTTAAATAVGAAALHAAHGLRKQVAALRTELADGYARAASVPPQSRSTATPAEEIRAAVAEALAEERERELAEARAFWAAQEARDAADAPSLLGGLSGLGEDTAPYYLPRQADFAGLESLDLEAAEAMEELVELSERTLAEHEAGELTDLPEIAEFPEDSPELAAARRRHPSHPDFVPVQTPVVTDHERTVSRLEELADLATELTDVRPGPLGTLDVYVFADGTTLCMTPGHRETAERLSEALRAGRQPVLLGGSGVSGAYALTFSCGEDNVYILADRVIASF
ncbi:hypothetical protein CIB93_13340 [Streptomyces sp. WZ.A104]|uniref:Secreted protein n=1 Tax=Streptomyces durocortorensis TaxID=2811104 RepID=A0ABY9W531_9ACTN|nr:MULTISPECIES: hypothetical protein [Streptomyces]PCG85534.1 hypothetical protein CIB93_13340 [Streptomyces sp. WZ.A104]WNF31242.1 hypothetical protein RI138_11750 [Streptomyces durocortorensis]